MPVTFLIASHGEPDPVTGLAPRRVEASATVATFQGPVVEPGGTATRTVRKVLHFYVRGGSEYQSKFSYKRPAEGWLGPLWKGEDNPTGPLEKIFIVDDAASERSGDLVDENGNPVEWEFKPTEPNGTEIV